MSVSHQGATVAVQSPVRSYVASIVAFVSLLFHLSTLTGCSLFYDSSVKRSPVAIIRTVDYGQYRYEIQISTHVIEHRNMRRPPGNRTGEFDQKYFLYVPKREGLFDASADVRVALSSGAPEYSAKLSGSVLLVPERVTVALEVIYPGRDGGQEKRYQFTEVNGEYNLVSGDPGKALGLEP